MGQKTESKPFEHCPQKNRYLFNFIIFWGGLAHHDLQAVRKLEWCSSWILNNYLLNTKKYNISRFQDLSVV